MRLAPVSTRDRLLRSLLHCTVTLFSPVFCLPNDTVRKSGRQLGQHAVAVHGEPGLELARGDQLAELLYQPALQSVPSELPWPADVQAQPPPSPTTTATTAAVLPVQTVREPENRESAGSADQPRATRETGCPGEAVRVESDGKHLVLAAAVAGVQERGRETDHQGDDGEEGRRAQAAAGPAREATPLYRVQ